MRQTAELTMLLTISAACSRHFHHILWCILHNHHRMLQSMKEIKKCWKYTTYCIVFPLTNGIIWEASVAQDGKHWQNFKIIFNFVISLACKTLETVKNHSRPDISQKKNLSIGHAQKIKYSFLILRMYYASIVNSSLFNFFQFLNESESKLSLRFSLPTILYLNLSHRPNGLEHHRIFLPSQNSSGLTGVCDKSQLSDRWIISN